MANEQIQTEPMVSINPAWRLRIEYTPTFEDVLTTYVHDLMDNPGDMHDLLATFTSVDEICAGQFTEAQLEAAGGKEIRLAFLSALFTRELDSGLRYDPDTDAAILQSRPGDTTNLGAPLSQDPRLRKPQLFTDRRNDWYEQQDDF